jgi:DNA-binding MarR family transcriptional regulator
VLDRTTDLSLSHLEYRVLMYVAYRLDETGLLDLSPQRLARDCGRNRTTAARSVRRALVRLEAMGLIDELRDGRFSTNPARASDGKQGP